MDIDIVIVTVIGTVIDTEIDIAIQIVINIAHFEHFWKVNKWFLQDYH